MPGDERLGSRDAGDDPHPGVSGARLSGDPHPGGSGARLRGDPPSPWEERYGFSRLVRAGGFVMVGGTTSVSGDSCIVGITPYEQAVEILGKIGHELSRVGLGFADVVSNRCYVTDISRSDEVGRAHGEVFAGLRPLMTMVEVSALIDPRMLVEIETVAWAG